MDDTHQKLENTMETQFWQFYKAVQLFYSFCWSDESMWWSVKKEPMLEEAPRDT